MKVLRFDRKAHQCCASEQGQQIGNLLECPAVSVQRGSRKDACSGCGIGTETNAPPGLTQGHRRKFEGAKHLIKQSRSAPKLWPANIFQLVVFHQVKLRRLPQCEVLPHAWCAELLRADECIAEQVDLCIEKSSVRQIRAQLDPRSRPKRSGVV